MYNMTISHFFFCLSLISTCYYFYLLFTDFIFSLNSFEKELCALGLSIEVNGDHKLSCYKRVLVNQLHNFPNIDAAKSGDLYVCSRAARKVLNMESSAFVIDYIFQSLKRFGCRLTAGEYVNTHLSFAAMALDFTSLHTLDKFKFATLSDQVHIQNMYSVNCNSQMD